MADEWAKKGHKLTTVLRHAQVPRSTYYSRRKHKDAPPKRHVGGRPAPGFSTTVDGRHLSDESIKNLICRIVEGDGYAYGYSKITVVLRREHGLCVNKKKVYRLCKELSILRPQRAKKPRYPRRISKNRVVAGPDELWEMDVKYGYIPGEGRFFFVVSLIDVYDRSVVASHIGLHATGHDAAATLGHALWRRGLLWGGKKPVVRTDNGPQFTSEAFEAACERYGVLHERIPPKTPNKIAHIEAFHRILEDECLLQHEFRTYAEAYQAVSDFMRFYNSRRIHSAVGFLTPDEAYRAFRSNRMRLAAIRA